MTTNLSLDQHGALTLRLFANFLQLPNASRKGDLTTALKEFDEMWRALHVEQRLPETFCVADEDGNQLLPPFLAIFAGLDNLVQECMSLSDKTLNPGD